MSFLNTILIDVNKDRVYNIHIVILVPFSEQKETWY